MAGEQILVIDDNLMNLKLLELLLRSEGYVTLAAQDAERLSWCSCTCRPR